jgi:hypothetical protein
MGFEREVQGGGPSAGIGFALVPPCPSMPSLLVWKEGTRKEKIKTNLIWHLVFSRVWWRHVDCWTAEGEGSVCGWSANSGETKEFRDGAGLISSSKKKKAI